MDEQETIDLEDLYEDLSPSTQENNNDEGNQPQPNGGEAPENSNNDEPNIAQDPSESNDEDGEIEPEENEIEVVGEGESAIEYFLSNYGIDGGIIEFPDGEAKHFNDLSETGKLDVLNKISEFKAQKTIDEIDLDDDETTLLNSARQAGLPIKKYISLLVEEQAAEIIAEANGPVSSKDVDDDSIMLNFLRESNPEASDIELKEELEVRKKSKFYENTVERIRDNYIEQEEAAKSEEENKRKEELHRTLEEQRFEIVQTVSDTDTVADWKVSDEEKNTILAKILEVNEFNDPVFMEEVFSEPKNLFKAAYLFYNAENKFNEMQSFYTKEMTKKYREGYEAAISGAPTKPIKTGNSGKSYTDNTAENNNDSNLDSLEDLY